MAGALKSWSPGRWFIRRPGYSGPARTRWLLLGGAFLLVLCAWGAGASDKPPHVLIDQTRKALAEARKADADVLASQEMQLAQGAWEAMLASLNETSARLPFFRSYDSVEVKAQFAEAAALAALERAREVSDSLARASQSDTEVARDLLQKLMEAAVFFPPGEVDRTSLASGRTLLGLAEGARDRQDPTSAARYAATARLQLEKTEQRVYALRDSLALEAAHWHRELELLLAKGHYPFIAVDKSARRLMLFRGTGRVDTFTVELGPQWLGDKAREGDKRTPEGTYRVIKRLTGGQTRYHRALLLDYPNASDRERFRRAQRERRLPDHARIGGLIEIHGGGGRSGDWTDGCVALGNADMELLFDRVPNGTPVLLAPALEL